MTTFKTAIIFAFLVLSYLDHSGQCIGYKTGQHVQLVSTSYANPLPFTEKKWDKMKTEDRDKLVRELNSEILSGNVAPWMNTTMNFEITAVQNDTPVSSFSIKATDGTYEYETTNYCENDTMHFVRNADVVYNIVNGDTLGLAIQGIQRIPNQLQVGDELPLFKDFMIGFPETWTKTVKESVKSFSYTTTENKVGYYQDSQSGMFSNGEFAVTERHDVYETINHQLTISQHIENLSIHYFVAKVTASEKIQLGTESREAFIIESESWSKAGIVRDYDAENERIEQEQQAKFEKMRTKQAEFNTKSGYTNEFGYIVTYKKEWFVPGYGIVKAEVFDQYGAIQVIAATQIVP